MGSRAIKVAAVVLLGFTTACSSSARTAVPQVSTTANSSAPRTQSSTSTLSDVTDVTLKTAETPGCPPPQRLENGTMEAPGPVSASIVTNRSLVRFADYAHLGYRQAMAIYRCSVGNIALPGTLVLIGTHGRLLASLGLGGVKASRSQTLVKSMTNDGNDAKIEWDSFDGAGVSLVHQRARVSYSAGKLVVSDLVTTYTPDAVLNEIIYALSTGSRDSLTDPRVITSQQWKELIRAGHDWTGGPCEVDGSVAHCTMTLTDTPVIMTMVTLVKAPGATSGWKVSSVPVPFES